MIRATIFRLKVIVLLVYSRADTQEAMSYFVPPCNYGMVEYDLSRSGHCHQLNFPFLERLNLKTVIYISHDEPSQPLYVYFCILWGFVLKLYSSC